MSTSDFEIPGYTLIEPIGKGGMASVYRALQHAFNRNVAIKLLDPELSKDDSFCKRFMMESQLIAKLNHSHIVQVYDVGSVDDHYFIAMEYLSGGNLTAKLDSGLDSDEAIQILKQIASALAFAHRKGIIHRDLKPDNVMFREDGAAVLTDFGVAKELDTKQDLTQTGVIIGTPKYMSPEQIRGADPSIASDVYSLGVLFYQLLTREVPFLGSDLVTTVYKQLNEPIPRLPGDLVRYQDIINRLLAKDVDQRISDCDEVVEALDRIESQPAGDDANPDKTVVLNRSMSGGDTTEVIDPGRTEVIGQGHTGYKKSLQQTPETGGGTTTGAEPKPIANRLAIALAAILVIGVGVTAALYFMPAADTPDQQARIEPINKGATDTAVDESTTAVITPEPDRPKTGVQQTGESTAIRETASEPESGPSETITSTTGIEPDKTDPEPIPLATDPPVQTATAKPPVRQKTILSFKQSMQIDGLFHGAALDEKEGRLTSPKGNNALEKYRRILSIQPDNQQAMKKVAALEKRR